MLAASYSPVRMTVQVRDHWLLGVAHRRSPFADERPGGMLPELIVIHGISLPPGEFGTGRIAELFLGTLPEQFLARFPDLRGTRLSAHVLLARDGLVTQFVAFDRRAWHAGRSAWRGRQHCNDFAVGIEVEGTDTGPYEAAQYDALAALVTVLRATYPSIAADALAGHTDVAPGRKTDPGPAFDWAALRARLH